MNTNRMTNEKMMSETEFQDVANKVSIITIIVNISLSISALFLKYQQ